jgi:Viral BACON domain
MKTLRNAGAFAAITLVALVGCAGTALAQCNTLLCAAPASLTFNGQTGVASSLPSQPITLTTNMGAPVAFAVSITSGVDWLNVDQLISVAPTILNASVKPGANSLAAGFYPATISFYTNGGPPVIINANLILSTTNGGSGLSASPNPLVFNVPAGTTPLTTSLTLTNNSLATTVNITGNTTWLSASPAFTSVFPGTPVIVVVTANPTGLVIGSYAANLTIAPATGTTLTIPVTLNVGGSPFGHIDTPTSGSTALSGAINFTGWALSPLTVSRVALCREPVTGEANVLDPNCLASSSSTGLLFLGNAVQVPFVRPDVAGAFPGFPNNNWGWGAQVLTNFLPGTGGLPLGNGTYNLHAIAADPRGLSNDLGTTTISVNNAASILPFGTIDTPAQGQTVSGSNFINFGWVVTPQPNIVPIDGSTITVHIDGVPVGHPVYNNFRSDIATLFQGLLNSNGAVGYFRIDTTKLSNGIHNIDWVATDSALHTAGIGSRNFFVSN